MQFNLMGIIPGVGTVIGIGRISIALNKAYENDLSSRTYTFASSFFERLRAQEGLQQIYQGSCELLPVAGPVAYYSIKLVHFIGNKMLDRFSVSEKQPASPKEPMEELMVPMELVAMSSMSDFENCRDRLVTFNVTPLANEKNFIEKDRNSKHVHPARYYTVTGKVVSIIQQVEEVNKYRPTGSKQEFRTRLTILNPKTNQEERYIMSDEEIWNVSREPLKKY